jgi:hypothetical protein
MYGFSLLKCPRGKKEWPIETIISRHVMMQEWPKDNC